MYEKWGEMVHKIEIFDHDTVKIESIKQFLLPEYFFVVNKMLLWISLYSDYNKHSKWNVLECFYT